MTSVSGFMDMIFINPRLNGEGNFRAICRLIEQQLRGDISIEGRSPKGIAYDIISTTIDEFYGIRNAPIQKKDIKKILNLSPTASRTRTNVQKRINEIYNDLKSRT